MIGNRIGPYEVLAKLGEGGMGEVYRARDTRLKRDVAIKVLPEAFARDRDRLARFEREAEVLATLNHPNIAHIYGFEDSGETHALALELVEGPTLADRIAAGPIPLAEALPIARQLADALEAAHERGVVHRDLKPANIKLTTDGQVKVLDFGLAKMLDADGSDSRPLNVTASPTMMSPAMTGLGTILGTAAYMAPEQARGKPIDKRADIWAFGIVLYEMLTRQRLFDGETVTDVVAQVLTRAIDLSALPAGTPARVRELVARCLDRDPKKRLRDIGEARIALIDPAADSSERTAAITTGAAAAAPAARRSNWLPWTIAAIAVIAAIGLAIALAATTSRPASSASSRSAYLEIGPPSEGDFIIGGNAGAIIISPDASMVAFLVQTSTGRKLFVRNLATGEAHAVAGVVDPSYPFWSPDSRKIGYFGSTKLYTVDLAGGLPEAITDIQQGRGGTWADNGTILYTPMGGGTVHRVSERGGAATEVTKLDPDRGENAHYWPIALPGGRRFLYFVRSRVLENNGIYLGTVDGSTKPVRIVTSLSSGLYSPAHHGLPARLLWVRDTNLLAQTIDVETGTLSGDVKTLATDVRVEESQRGTFAGVANDGSLVWSSAQAADYQFGIVDREGRRQEMLPILPGKIMQPTVSPDDRTLLFTRANNGTADIYTYEFASKETRQVTTDPEYDESGRWSPDAHEIFYLGTRNSGQVSLISPIDNSKPPQILTRGEIDVGAYAHDNRSVFVVRNKEQDVALIRLSDPTKAIPLTKDPGLEGGPSLSPDGRWLAFTTDRSGHSEIVLASYHDDGITATLGDQRVPVSTGGGVDAHWRKDGKEIIYTAPDASLQAVSVTVVGNSVAVGRPTPLPISPADVGGSGSNWAANSTHTVFVTVEAPRATRQTFRVLLGK